MTNTASLPSIREIFPEHMPRTPPEVEHFPSMLIPPYSYVPPHINRSRYSFDVFRRDCASAPLRYTALPPCLPYQLQSCSLPRHESTPMLSEEGESVLDEQDRKHVCTVCNRRFNRPSSLRIHANTHTGATPFQCPFPGCGRQFNVNSNMRRHYRNHTNPGAASCVPAPLSSPSPPSSRLHSSLLYQKHDINLSKHIRFLPPPSNTSSDNEEVSSYNFRPVIDRRCSRRRDEERDFDAHSISDVHPTRDAYDYGAAAPVVYSYSRAR